MLYNLAQAYDREKLAFNLERLKAKGAVVEFHEKGTRTLSQNAYLHLILGILAMETGVTLEYAKEMYFKRLCNPDIFVQKRNDTYMGEVEIVLSTAGIQKETMSKAIDRLKSWAREQGIYLPAPGDTALLLQAEVEIGRCKWL